VCRRSFHAKTFESLTYFITKGNHSGIVSVSFSTSLDHIRSRHTNDPHFRIAVEFGTVICESISILMANQKPVSRPRRTVT